MSVKKWKGLAITLALLLTGCAPASVSPSPSAAPPTPTGIPLATPAPLDITERTAAFIQRIDLSLATQAPEGVLPDHFAQPDAAQTLSLSSLTGVRSLSAYYSGMLTYIARSSDGAEGIYIQMLPGTPTLLYRPDAAYPNIAGVSGSKFRVFFVEYSAGGLWRLRTIDQDNPANVQTLRSGVFTKHPPIYKDGFLLMDVEENGAVYSRLYSINPFFDEPLEHSPLIMMDVEGELDSRDFRTSQTHATLMVKSSAGPLVRGYAAPVFAGGNAAAALAQQDIQNAAFYESYLFFQDASGALYVKQWAMDEPVMLDAHVVDYKLPSGFASPLFFIKDDGRTLGVTLSDVDDFGVPTSWAVADFITLEAGARIHDLVFFEFEMTNGVMLVEKDGQFSLQRFYYGTAGE